MKTTTVVRAKLALVVECSVEFELDEHAARPTRILVRKQECDAQELNCPPELQLVAYQEALVNPDCRLVTNEEALGFCDGSLGVKFADPDSARAALPDGVRRTP